MRRLVVVLAAVLLVGCGVPGATPTPDPTTPQLQQALGAYETALEVFNGPSIWPSEAGQPGATLTRATFENGLDALDEAALGIENVPLSPHWEQLEPRITALSTATVNWTQAMWSCYGIRDFVCADESPLWDTMTARYEDLANAFTGK